MVAHTDLLQNFAKGAKKLPEMTLTVHAALPFLPTRAKLCTPECDEELSLSIEQDGDALRINVPANVFAGYAFVALEP
jgi:hypothetical protein